MSLTTQHPAYALSTDNWRILRDLYMGEAHVKNEGETYLPATSGMKLDGMRAGETGYDAYQAYKKRALLPDYVREGVEILVGLLHQKDATIELPTQLESLRERATSSGESLRALLRRINTEQLVIGRVGLLVDLPENPNPENPLPYIALYAGETITNWDDSSDTEGEDALNLVVLNESKFEREGHFNWRMVNKYRVLQLGTTERKEHEGTAPYMMGIYSASTVEGLAFDESTMRAPMLRGKALASIPFTFINTKDLLPQPDEPPLIGLANLTLAIYRAEADYRQSLFMQGQDTLVVIGGVRNPSGIPGEPEAIRTGAGSRIDVDLAGDAKYIGVASTGLTEQRISLENDRKRAQIKAGELVQSSGSQQESGEALNTRFTAQTATLNHIALSAAAGLEKALRQIASWMGIDEKSVKVTPNLEFVNFGLDGQNFVQIMQARQMGFPISIESLHAIAADRGMTVMDFLTEMAKIEEENKTLALVLPNAPAPGTPVPSGAAPNDPKQKIQQDLPAEKE